MSNSTAKYCRFVILGRGRSGSNFLRGMLNRHSQVVVFGELFRFPGEIGWEFPDDDRDRQTPALIALSQDRPADFLQHEVFGEYREPIRAVGFKLFYYHAMEEGRNAVWPFLKEQQDIKIIHLTRRNTLRQLLSEKLAFATDSWTNLNGAPEKKLSICLDYEECVRMFHRVSDEQEQFGNFFPGHATLDLVYEDLARDREGEMTRVQDFLGIPREALVPVTYKQGSQALSEAIVNYDELRSRFLGTPWEIFFDEKAESDWQIGTGRI